MSQWVEYLNFDGISPMADLRRANGREKAWGVKFWGVGNENWGCGGNMTADFYADQFRRYATFCRNYGDSRLFKIAGGANSEDYGWTETLMQKIPHRMMDGISLHYYTSNWSHKGPATGFGEDLYFDILKRCLHIEKAIDRHMEIMDRYDPDKNVALVFDEWGTWYDVEPGTNPGFLFQQNSMRDALVAALTLNYLNARCERVRMANIAQTINVLQALIFTDGEKMLLTPTYHIYHMYKVHHDATLLPQILESPDYMMGTDTLPAISASASMDKAGLVHLSLVNIDPHQAIQMEVQLEGKVSGKVTGQLLSSELMDSHNSFAQPEEVVPMAFEGARFKKGKLELTIPAHSVVVLEVE
jgi:alpha-N-arabinofuranosidase